MRAQQAFTVAFVFLGLTTNNGLWCPRRPAHSILAMPCNMMVQMLPVVWQGPQGLTTHLFRSSFIHLEC